MSSGPGGIFTGDTGHLFGSVLAFFSAPRRRMGGLGAGIKGYLGIVSNGLLGEGEQIQVCRDPDPGYPRSQELQLGITPVGKWFWASLTVPQPFSACRIHGCIWGTLGKAWNFPIFLSLTLRTGFWQWWRAPHTSKGGFAQIQAGIYLSSRIFPGFKWVLNEFSRI